MKFFFLLLLVTFSTFGAVIEAPVIGADFNQNPSDIEWRHITTKHFDIIFPAEVEEEAKRVAGILEKAYPYVSRSLEVMPPRIPLILQNQSVNSNGFVTLAPRRSEFYLTPSIDPELSNTEWLKTLAIHEFRHVVQFQKTRRGFNEALEFVLGEMGQALGLALTLPPWFYEGDAVGIETALTRGGRGRLPIFDRDLRTLLLSGKRWNYDKAHLGSYDDFIPNHYVYGYFYTSWMRNHYGDLFLSKLANQSAETSWNPLSFYNATEHLTNEKFETFYEKVMKDLVGEWKKRTDKINPTSHEVKNKKKRFGWTNYFYPQPLKDGKVLALKRGLSFIDRFVILDGKNETELFYPGILQNEYPYKVRNEKLAFFEWEFDPRWCLRDFSRLKVYDLEKKKFILDKRKLKGRLAVTDHSGNRILYVNWSEKQGQHLIVLDMKGNELKRIPHPKDDVITSIDWLGEDEAVLVTRDHFDHKSLIQINLETRAKKTLIEKRLTNIGFVSVYDGKIFFEGPESGIDNIWMITLYGPRQITSAKFGAYAPALLEGKLLYNDYTAGGMNIGVKSLPLEEEQKSADSFYPIYEKFAKSEDLFSLEKEATDNTRLESTEYSQVKNAVNLHSWVILAPPLSNTLTLVGYSKDVLNKFTLSAGAEYNLNEQTLQGFAGATWTHLYPVFDLKAAYGNRRQVMTESGGEFENKWEEGTLEAGVSIPWRLIQGRFVHSFTTRAFSKMIKVVNKISDDEAEISNGALISSGAELAYSVTQRMAKRDMNPMWGLVLNARAEEGQDISGNDQKGSLHSFDGRFFLPGLWYHHSFYHQLAFEKQRPDAYEYSSFILYPRGTRSVFLGELTKYSGNYLMPLFYPDYNLSRYVYFRRIALNLFYDELNGQNKGLNYRAASTGWETIVEMNFLRLMLPVSLGVRASYVLDGFEKGSNYEIFLASTLGTF
jgi:hypothetical protein